MQPAEEGKAMGKQHVQKRLVEPRQANPSHDANGGSRAGHKRTAFLEVGALTEAQLQGLIAEHLGMIATEPMVTYVPGIAEHVLPAGWTPVR